MQKLLITIIRGYRLLLSPFIGHQCRFYPTCSCYSETAIEKYGVFKGLNMSMRRIAKCHPWHEGGIDPVPEIEHKQTKN